MKEFPGRSSRGRRALAHHLATVSVFFTPPTLLEPGLQEIASVQHNNTGVAVYTSNASSPFLFLVADGELTGRILYQACRRGYSLL